MDTEKLLSAARAEAIPEGWSGLWFVEKLHVLSSTLSYRRDWLDQIHPITLPANTYTYLRRLTDSTIYNDQPGEIVMEDTPFELRTHLQFMLKARGRVLVTGLGLGCVVRGLLANPAVEHVTCVENSPDVLRLVEPHMPKDRLTIIEACALEWAAKNKQVFDFAWHDLWTDRDAGEPHLDIWHAQLIFNCRNRIRHQGAWNLSRTAKKILKRAKRPIDLIA